MVLKIFKNQYFWLGLILVVAFILRLYKIDSAIADWHAWRQVDTAAVSRNFLKEGFNPFIPKYDDMVAISEQNVPNYNRYRFVEFPIYNTLVYFLYLLNGGVDVRLARLVSILMSLGSTAFIFLIVRKYWGKFTALTAALIFAILPFNIFFSRTTLPEPTLVFFSLGMFYFVNRWIFENTKRLFALSVFFTATAFLIKPMAGFYLLPLIYSYFQKEKKLWPVPWRYFLWLGLSLAPFAAWRWWMSYFPEGIPRSNWLLNGNGIRFRPAFWQWIINDRFGREILTVPGVALFLLGLVRKDEKGNHLLHLLMLSSFLYIIVFATGNVTHDYYQVLIVPALSIFLARGLVTLLQGIPGFLPRIWTIPLAILCFILTIYFGWGVAKAFYQINNDSIVVAGEYADKTLPKDAVVVAPWGGDTAFLYQVNRPGLAIMALPPEEIVKEFGITHYLSVNYDNDTNKFMRQYKILKATDRFILLDLRVKDSDPGKAITIEKTRQP